MGVKILKHRYSKAFQTILQEITRISAQCHYRSITIEKDAISSAIISGDGNKVVIYQYQLERQASEETIFHSEEIGYNPYKELLAFQSEDGDRYFGREKQMKTVH